MLTEEPHNFLTPLLISADEQWCAPVVSVGVFERGVDVRGEAAASTQSILSNVSPNERSGPTHQLHHKLRP